MMSRGVVLVALVALSWACGSSESNGSASGSGASSGSGSGGTTSSGGSAGATGTGGGGTSSSGGASGSGGTSSGGSSSGGSAGTMSGPPATDSLRYACRQYVLAACLRREECTGLPLAGCTSFAEACPDFLFSEGSTRTREAVLACAETYRTQPCEEVIAKIPPACATPGSLPDGSGCLFNSQCQGTCTAQGNTCGECLPLAPEDGACGADIGCQLGQACSGSVCVDDVYEVDETVLPGGNCEYSCITGYSCLRASPGATPTCMKPPEAGAPCLYELIEDSVGNEGACGGGLYCDANFTCQPLPEPGQACISDGGILRCQTGACTDGTCPVLDNPGATCNRNSAIGCQGGTSCRCPTDASCTEGICVFVQEEGQSCAGTYDRCAPGTVCTGGVCVATDELTAAAACQ